MTILPQREMSMVTYILIFAYLKAIGSCRKTGAVPIVNTLVKVWILKRFFRHYSKTNMKQPLVNLYVMFDTYILKSWLILVRHHFSFIIITQVNLFVNKYLEFSFVTKAYGNLSENRERMSMYITLDML